MSKLTFAALALTVGVSAAGAQQSRAQRLTKPVEFWNPDWSPDGKSLAFESTMDGKYSVYTINADGSGLRRLTADTANSEQPRWSPDAKRIVFSSDRGTGHSDIYVMNADGSGQTRITTTPSGGHYQSSFSPDGRSIVFQGRPDNAEVRDRVYVVGSDAAGMRQVTDSTYGAESPRWSADGTTITFTQVPYPKRLWSEMQPGDMSAAHAGERTMSVHADGSGLVPITVSKPSDARPVPDAKPSLNGRAFAYTKSADGYAGLYVYDVASKSERMIAGGAGAGPVGYLRTATLRERVDSIDTYTSPRGSGPIERGGGEWVIRTVKRVGGRRWETNDSWIDTAGKITAVQTTRTASGSLATELETVRANSDSASMLVTPTRVTAWVVPGGKPAQLFDGPGGGDRFDGAFVAAAIAKAKPTVGQTFMTTSTSLYGGNPLEVRVDSLRVVRRDTLYRGNSPLPVIVLERGSGQVWVEEATGAEVLSRGNAQPGRWWWHIRRGVQPPTKF